MDGEITFSGLDFAFSSAKGVLSPSFTGNGFFCWGVIEFVRKRSWIGYSICWYDYENIMEESFGCALEGKGGLVI